MSFSSDNKLDEVIDAKISDTTNSSFVEALNSQAIRDPLNSQTIKDPLNLQVIRSKSHEKVAKSVSYESIVDYLDLDESDSLVLAQPPSDPNLRISTLSRVHPNIINMLYVLPVQQFFHILVDCLTKKCRTPSMTDNEFELIGCVMSIKIFRKFHQQNKELLQLGGLPLRKNPGTDLIRTFCMKNKISDLLGCIIDITKVNGEPELHLAFIELRNKILINMK